jgi:predicted phosphodiesterase
MKGKGIGLIADSHGNLDATAEAIRLLKERDAGILVHLGDFCDSVRRDRAGAMIRLLRENSVLAVKGNNDFFMESVLTDKRRPPDPEGEPAIAFLQALPFTRALNGLLFAHSLPYDTLRSFYEPIDTGNTQRAERLFAETDFRVLFCGHSHLPVIFRKADSRVTREQPTPGEKRVLCTEEETPDAITGGLSPDRFIVVVGAADDGECAFYDRESGVYERIRIFSHPSGGSDGG